MKNKLRKRTRTLSNYELNVLLPILMKGLETKKGKDNAVSGWEIIEGLRSHGLKINNMNMNMLINYIRTNDLIEGLMGTSAGYYTSNSEQELIAYEDTLMSREASIRKVRMSIKRQRRAMFSPAHKEKQTQLF